MKHPLIALLLLGIFCLGSCNKDDETTPANPVTDLSELAEDPIFLTFVDEFVKDDIRITNVSRYLELTENLENLSEAELDELFQLQGFANYEEYEQETLGSANTLVELNEKYALFDANDRVVDSIYRVVIDRVLSGNAMSGRVARTVINRDLPDCELLSRELPLSDPCGECYEEYAQNYRRILRSFQERTEICTENDTEVVSADCLNAIQNGLDQQQNIFEYSCCIATDCILNPETEEERCDDFGMEAYCQQFLTS